MQWCNCVVSLLLSIFANLNTDSGLQHWVINSYTTTGHNLPQSHLPTKQDAYITTWVVPAAKTRAQSAPATCSLLHTKHTSLSHSIDCYSAVQGQLEINNDGYQMLSSEIFAVVSFHTLVSLPRISSFLVYSSFWPWSGWEYLGDDTGNQGHICAWKRGAMAATTKHNDQSSDLGVWGRSELKIERSAHQIAPVEIFYLPQCFKHKVIPLTSDK